MIEDITTFEQLVPYAWASGVVLGAFICIIWDITDDDDRDL